MRIVREPITNQELKEISDKNFGHLVKAVVDIEQNIMAIDAELHADLEEFLLEHGSAQKNVWGINIHPDNVGQANWIEFDSMINIRPSQGNRSRGVDDSKVCAIIIKIVQHLVTL